MQVKPKERRVLIRSGLGVAVAAIGFIALGSTSTALAQGAGCTGNGKISKQIAKPMAAAQDAQKAKKWQEVLAKTREAQAVPAAKSAWDQHWIHELQGARQPLLPSEELPEGHRLREPWPQDLQGSRATGHSWTVVLPDQ